MGPNAEIRCGEATTQVERRFATGFERPATQSGLERRFVTGFSRWVVQSQLPTGAPLWLQLRCAMYNQYRGVNLILLPTTDLSTP